MSEKVDTPYVLVADDQPDVLEALRLLLKFAGYAALTTSSPAGVLDALAERDFDVVLIDMNYARDTTSGSEGLELLQSIAELDPTLPVIVMTAWGSVEGAVDAMRRGAFDFLQKPFGAVGLSSKIREMLDNQPLADA